MLNSVRFSLLGTFYDLLCCLFFSIFFVRFIPKQFCLKFALKWLNWWCHFLFILITVLNYFNVINLNAISIVTHSKSLRFPSNNKLIYEFTEVEVTADLHLTQDDPVGLGEFYVEFLWSVVICLILTSLSLLFFLFTYNINFKRVFIQW